MIHPLTKTPIAGVIWYQGENDTHQAYTYRILFKTLINDWRAKWGYEFPFYWVQLANFMTAPSQPEESAWAELRESQGRALSLPNTGQVVTIDVGDANDIHPRNKQAVGSRLAVVALSNYYDKTIVASGPRFKSVDFSNGKALVSFEYSEIGLYAKGDSLKGFSIAGKNKKFVWAHAKIEGDKVIVWSADVRQPVAVRYAWADNPQDANLYNTANLPAAPFRTDNWAGITFNN